MRELNFNEVKNIAGGARCLCNNNKWVTLPGITGSYEQVDDIRQCRDICCKERGFDHFWESISDNWHDC